MSPPLPFVPSGLISSATSVNLALLFLTNLKILSAVFFASSFVFNEEELVAPI